MAANIRLVRVLELVRVRLPVLATWMSSVDRDKEHSVAVSSSVAVINGATLLAQGCSTIVRWETFASSSRFYASDTAVTMPLVTP